MGGDHKVNLVNLAEDREVVLDREFRDEVTGEVGVNSNRSSRRASEVRRTTCSITRRETAMKKHLTRGIAVPTPVATAPLAPATAAIAEPRQAPPEDVVVVDEPDTGDLHDKWAFAPLGVPVFGLIDSVLGPRASSCPYPAERRRAAEEVVPE